MSEWTNRSHLEPPECPRCGNLGWHEVTNAVLYEASQDSSQERFQRLVGQALDTAKRTRVR
jgi:hypothetical protein